jgi:hypothetical protein
MNIILSLLIKAYSILYALINFRSFQSIFTSLLAEQHLDKYILYLYCNFIFIGLLVSTSFERF